MAEMTVPSSEPYLEEVVSYFNTLLRDTDYWCKSDQMKWRLQEYFNNALFDDELEEDYDLRQSLINSFPKFFLKLQNLCRVKLTPTTNELLKNTTLNPNQSPSDSLNRIKLLKVDVQSISAKVKHIDLIDMAEAKMLYKQAANNRDQSERLFAMANERFRSAISANPNNPQILYSWGKSLQIESRIHGARFARTSCLTESDALLKRACDFKGGQFNFQQYFLRVDVLIQLASHYSSEKPKEYDYLCKAEQCLLQMFSSSPQQLETEMYDKVKQVYQELNPITLVDELESFFLEKNLKIPSAEARGSPSKESRDKVITSFICAYHWHRLFLEFKYSGTVIVQAADILRRLATYMVTYDVPFSENLFARAGQILEMVFLRSKLICPISVPGTGKIRSILLELATRPYPMTPLESPVATTPVTTRREALLKMRDKTLIAGYMQVRRNKKFHTYYCMVIDGIFGYQKNKEDDTTFQIVCTLNDKVKIRCVEVGFILQLENGNIELTLVADSYEEMVQWLNCFKRFGIEVSIDVGGQTISKDSTRARFPKILKKKTSQANVTAVSSSFNISKSIREILRSETSEEPDVTDRHKQTMDSFNQYQIRLKFTEELLVEARKIRQLIPSVRTCYLKESTLHTVESFEQLFHINGTVFGLKWTLDVFFTMDFGDVELVKIEVRLNEKHTLSKENNKTVGAQMCLLVCKDYPEKFLDAFLKTNNVEDIIELIRHESKDTIDVVVLDISITQQQTFSLHSPKRGCYFWMKLIPKGSLELNIQYISFYGSLCGLEDRPTVSRRKVPRSNIGRKEARRHGEKESPPKERADKSPRGDRRQPRGDQPKSPRDRKKQVPMMGSTGGRTGEKEGSPREGKKKSPSRGAGGQERDNIGKSKHLTSPRSMDSRTSDGRSSSPRGDSHVDVVDVPTDLGASDTNVTDFHDSRTIDDLHTVDTRDPDSSRTPLEGENRISLSSPVNIVSKNLSMTDIRHTSNTETGTRERRHSKSFLSSNNEDYRQDLLCLHSSEPNARGRRQTDYQHSSTETRAPGKEDINKLLRSSSASPTRNFSGTTPKKAGPGTSINSTKTKQPREGKGHKDVRNSTPTPAHRVPTRGREPESLSRVRTHSATTSEHHHSGLSEDRIIIDFFAKMFTGYGWLATVLRMAEHSEVLRVIVGDIIKAHTPQNPNPELTDSYSFYKSLPSSNPPTTPYLDSSQETCAIRLDILHLYGSKIINKFVLEEFVSWGLCHTIDLSYTAVTDGDILGLILKKGSDLVSLSLKGCGNLGLSTMTRLIRYCPNLRHLGVWDNATEPVLTVLHQLPKLEYLDLSHCTITKNVLDKLNSFKYLDLSLCQCNFESSRLPKWARSKGNSLEGLFLRRYNKLKTIQESKDGPREVLKDDDYVHIFNDECLCEIIKSCPNLKIIDLEYCREITDVTLNALCERTQLRSINLNGITKLTSLTIKKLASSLPLLEELELYFRSTSNEVESIAETLKLNQLTSLTLRQLSMTDGISDVIKANCKTLTKLHLSIYQITDKTGLEIANCSELVELQMQGCSVVSEDTFNLIAKKCVKLIVVGFQGCRHVTNKTLQILLQTNHPYRSLHTLLLDGCEQPTPAILSHIGKHSEMRILSLKLCPFVTVEEILALAKCLQKLYFLDISKCPRLPKKSLIQGTVGEEAFDMLYQELVVSLPMGTIINYSNNVWN